MATTCTSAWPTVLLRLQQVFRGLENQVSLLSFPGNLFYYPEKPWAAAKRPMLFGSADYSVRQGLKDRPPPDSA